MHGGLDVKIHIVYLVGKSCPGKFLNLWIISMLVAVENMLGG